MDINHELGKLVRYSALEKLLEAVERPTRYAPEAFTFLLPSLVMGADGPSLRGLTLVSDQYLCDVRLGTLRADFDFICKKTLMNYRIEFSTHEVKVEGAINKVYELAKVRLIHHHSGLAGFETELTYAGDDSDSWVNLVLEAMPIALLGKSL